MIREAELFVMSERTLVEVLGRLRPGQGKIVLPPLFDGHSSLPIRLAVARHARDDAWVPGVLAGDVVDDRFDVDLLGDDPRAAVTRLADAACAAAEQVSDGDAVVHAEYGDATARRYLLRETSSRSFLAHDVAMHLGSRACPLTEELARGMWEATSPEADAWREEGVFGEPLTPVPADVSWRDRFLMSAGRDPHALDH